MKWELVEDAATHEADSTPVAASVVSPPPASAPMTDSPHRDLDLIEQLLDRCWREIDTNELNVKLADLVRLLEFKEKLRPAVEAQATFWSMIQQMRRDELARFGDTDADRNADREQDTDHATNHDTDA